MSCSQAQSKIKTFKLRLRNPLTCYLRKKKYACPMDSACCNQRLTFAKERKEGVGVSSPYQPHWLHCLGGKH